MLLGQRQGRLASGERSERWKNECFLNIVLREHKLLGKRKGILSCLPLTSNFQNTFELVSFFTLYHSTEGFFLQCLAFLMGPALSSDLSWMAFQIRNSPTIC